MARLLHPGRLRPLAIHASHGASVLLHYWPLQSSSDLRCAEGAMRARFASRSGRPPAGPLLLTTTSARWPCRRTAGTSHSPHEKTLPDAFGSAFLILLAHNRGGYRDPTDPP